MKIYKCELCQKKFNQKSNLIAHANRKFKCIDETIEYSIKDVVKLDVVKLDMTAKTQKNKTKKIIK